MPDIARFDNAGGLVLFVLVLAALTLVWIIGKEKP